jgi:hypothetical protein
LHQQDLLQIWTSLVHLLPPFPLSPTVVVMVNLANKENLVSMPCLDPLAPLAMFIGFLKWYKGTSSLQFLYLCYGHKYLCWYLALHILIAL